MVRLSVPATPSSRWTSTPSRAFQAPSPTPQRRRVGEQLRVGLGRRMRNSSDPRAPRGRCRTKDPISISSQDRIGYRLLLTQPQINLDYILFSIAHDEKAGPLRADRPRNAHYHVCRRSAGGRSRIPKAMASSPRPAESQGETATRQLRALRRRRVPAGEERHLIRGSAGGGGGNGNAVFGHGSDLHAPIRTNSERAQEVLPGRTADVLTPAPPAAYAAQGLVGADDEGVILAAVPLRPRGHEELERLGGQGRREGDGARQSPTSRGP
jgi:hypothetical protein